MGVLHRILVPRLAMGGRGPPYQSDIAEGLGNSLVVHLSGLLGAYLACASSRELVEVGRLRGPGVTR